MKHLLNIEQMSMEWINNIYKLADVFRTSTSAPNIRRAPSVAILFYEDSTRTRTSFIMASNAIGAFTIDLNPHYSSQNKGESLEDTAKTLSDLGMDAVVIRHSAAGAASLLAKALSGTKVSVINAGDGMNEHPSQALLDVYTLLQSVPSLLGRRILILGDCLHSRVAKSNIRLLLKFGVKVVLAGPPALLPAHFAALGVQVVHNLVEGLRGCDFVMVLRIQRERLSRHAGASLAEYSNDYQLTELAIQQAGLRLQDIKVLHPGPVNWGVEIEASLADNKSVSLIHRQVENGLFVRMAILHNLLNLY